MPPRGDQRSPIFDSLESTWFRSRGQHIGDAAQQPVWEVTVQDDEMARAWTSPADEGWSAAHAAAEPAVGEVTAAGLPRRVPQANSVPGSVATQTSPAPALARSPETARTRLQNFQEGVRQARAAIATEERPDE